MNNDIKELYLLLMHISLFSGFVPAFFYLKKKWKLKDFTLFYLFWVILASTLADWISYIAIYWLGYHNIEILNIYILIEFVAVSILYSTMLPYYQKTIYILIGAYCALFISSVLFVHPFDTFQTWPHLIGNMIIIGYGFATFYYIRHTPLNAIFDQSIFYINAGLVVYFLGTCSTMFVMTILQEEISRKVFSMMLICQCIANICKNMFFLAGLNQGELESVELRTRDRIGYAVKQALDEYKKEQLKKSIQPSNDGKSILVDKDKKKKMGEKFELKM